MKGIDAVMLKRGALLALFNVMFLLVVLLHLSVLAFLANMGILIVLGGASFNFSTGEKVPVKEAGTVSKDQKKKSTQRN
eukprot:3633520-Amphidinium_carterae.1